MKIQLATEEIDVSISQDDPEFAVYPEGTRPKTAHFFVTAPPFPFLLQKHRYLFKMSYERYPEQFWTEIAAYRIGSLMSIQVPPAFAAHNSATGKSGALIEWFYSQVPEQTYTPGGELLQRRIPQYDRKKGRQHNLSEIIAVSAEFERMGILEGSWISHWAKVLVFDALIGNTDRHQDNWGILTRIDRTPRITFSPAFDNGTSMGHEILSTNFDTILISNYIGRGRHHMKWNIDEKKGMGHISLLLKFSDSYPEAREYMMNSLQFDLDEAEKSIIELTRFNLPQRLSEARARFMSKLLRLRHKNITKALEANCE